MSERQACKLLDLDRTVIAISQSRSGMRSCAPTDRARPAEPKTAPAKAPVQVKKGGLTEARRKGLSIAMRKRWAAKKKVAKG
jgi:hypothetical protein